jgi:ubiquitin carboxyl-terminal hydrolase 9/13
LNTFISGPHHGHYVTIIRTPATWLLFDDETVEPIKESEITKYFGESNSGSAYVLYYQAVDLDLAALGLRPVIPVPVPESAEVTTRQSMEPSTSPSLVVPSLPPGLADDVDSTDASEPPLSPITPSQPSLIAPIVGGALPEPSSSQPLRINVSSGSNDDTPALPGSAPVSPTAGAKAGLFHSLRHSPSMKVRVGSGGSTGLEKRKSVKEKIARPATSPGLPKRDDPPEPLPPVPPLMQPALANGKDAEPEKAKEPERKPSLWFKRKNGRTEKRPGTSGGTSNSPELGGDVNPSSLPAATAWFRNHIPATSEPSKTSGPSEPSLNDVGVFRSLLSSSPKISHTPKHSADLGLAPHFGVRDGRGGNDSSSPGSAASSFASSSVQSPDIPASTVQLPTIPGSPQGSTAQTLNTPANSLPPSPHSPVDHKRSQPFLKTKKSKDLKHSHSTKLPPRPSTAGASAGGAAASKPPPMPPLPAFAPAHRRTASTNPSSDTTHNTNDGWRPNSTFVATKMGTDPTAGSNAPALNSSGTTSAPLKRPSRKLSLSSPILGFGKKEKNKEKEKPFSYEKVTDRNAKEKEKADKARAKEVEKEEKAQEKARLKEAKKREQDEFPLVSAFPGFVLASRV